MRERIPDRLWRAANVVGVLLLVAIVLPFVIYAIPQLVGATGSFVVVSDSMAGPPQPALNAGDVVFVYDTPPERIDEGDVITFRSGAEQFTTHRVVEVRNTEDGLAFRTKGDANEEADSEPVPAAAVVGTVRFSIPLIGHVIVFAGTTRGILALIIVPAALLVLTEVWSLAKASMAGREGDAAPTAEGEE